MDEKNDFPYDLYEKVREDEWYKFMKQPEGYELFLIGLDVMISNGEDYTVQELVAYIELFFKTTSEALRIEEGATRNEWVIGEGADKLNWWELGIQAMDPILRAATGLEVCSSFDEGDYSTLDRLSSGFLKAFQARCAGVPLEDIMA